MRKLRNLILFSVVMLTSCYKATEYDVCYRVTQYQDGCKVYYRYKSDTLKEHLISGTYTLAKPWEFRFRAKEGEILYLCLIDTIENSFSKAQILIDGKIIKEKMRSNDRFMPVVVSTTIQYK